jgi:hypothetical protein
MSHISYECPTEFNVVTNLKSCNEYRKDLQESTDPLKYRFDIRPGPMCYMTGQNFQGLRSSSARNPPAQLLDTELTLRALPLKEQDNQYVTKNIHSSKPPKMPDILSNRLIIPDCQDMLQWQRTKIRRIDFPQFSQRMDRTGFFVTNYMRPGRDTRSEMRQAFKQYEQQNAKTSTVYGVSKFDQRPLTPAVDQSCTNANNIPCMHLYEPDANLTRITIDPKLTLSQQKARHQFRSDKPLTDATSKSASRLEAMRIAQTIDPKTPYLEQVKDTHRENSCLARFYDFVPPGCD